MLLLILLASGALAAPRVDPLVDSPAGLLRGLPAADGGYSMFLGIPYAVVDEENPFAPSTPHPGFNSTFEAYDDSAVCPQANFMTAGATGVLQCLNLNVFVPNSASTQNRLPVLVWIHGGGFVGGDGGRAMSGPKYLVKHDVVLVSINYRLGLYGFLCTDSPKAPGNIGLRDQTLALKWVKDNIAAFGGDTSKITIMGESAGGMSVHLHLLSNNERLFDKAIIESGASTSPWTVVEQNNDAAFRVAEGLGLVTEDLDEAIDFIARADVKLAVAVAAELKVTSIGENDQPLTKPCVEKEFEGIDRFVTAHPNFAKPNANIKNVPVIFGYNSEEMFTEHAGRSEEYYENFSFENLLNTGFEATDDLVEYVRHFYIGDEPLSSNVTDDIIHFASDLIFNHATDRAVKHLIDEEAKVFRYVFGYVGDRNMNKMGNQDLVFTEAAHGDELGYLFSSDSNDELSERDQLMVDRMTTMWTNFVKTGNPTPEVSTLLPVQWQSVATSSGPQPYLLIDEELTAASRPYHTRMAFWDLVYRLYEKQVKGYPGDQ